MIRSRCRMAHFNPLPPHGGRLCGSSLDSCSRLFQSTPSAWRETQDKYPLLFILDISIHSLRMEGDERIGSEWILRRKFQSTPSAWRETSGGSVLLFMAVVFQSTPSAWRETYRSSHHRVNRCISIHSLRMEGDPTVIFVPVGMMKFQSTPSAWRETTRKATPKSTRLFQSTPSAWRETADIAQSFQFCRISIHSLRMEGDRFKPFTLKTIL